MIDILMMLFDMFHREFIEFLLTHKLLYKYVVNKIDYDAAYVDILKTNCF